MPHNSAPPPFAPLAAPRPERAMLQRQSSERTYHDLIYSRRKASLASALTPLPRNPLSAEVRRALADRTPDHSRLCVPPPHCGSTRCMRA